MSLSPRRIVGALVCLDALVVALYLVVHHLIPIPSDTIRQWFDLDAELNFPTYVSTVQLLLIGALCSWRAAHGFTPEDRNMKPLLLAMAAGFVFLSIDEMGQIHERITLVGANAGITSPFPGGHDLWLLVYPVLALVVLLPFLPGLLTFVRRGGGHLWFLVGMSILVTGGALVELGSGYFSEVGELSRYVFITVEEALEMSGQLVMIAAGLRLNESSTLSLQPADH